MLTEFNWLIAARTRLSPASSSLQILRTSATLKEALDNLEKDTVLIEALGPLLSRAYLAVKRLEWESFSKEDIAFETKHHFWKF